MSNSKLVTFVLSAILLAMQWPIWFDKGGWFAVREQRMVLTQTQSNNKQKEARNAQLKADVSGLEDGNAAVEERARFVLGMVSKSERYIQITQP